ncbi:MAG: hypothetical protein K0S74_1884 [Chlamydiales bacterium]|jgi:hypothetical protein|nr:hypothetical protein [Chlamydiales bacterium]
MTGLDPANPSPGTNNYPLDLHGLQTEGSFSPMLISRLNENFVASNLEATLSTRKIAIEVNSDSKLPIAQEILESSSLQVQDSTTSEISFGNLLQEVNHASLAVFATAINTDFAIKSTPSWLEFIKSKFKKKNPIHSDEEVRESFKKQIINLQNNYKKQISDLEPAINELQKEISKLKNIPEIKQTKFTRQKLATKQHHLLQLEAQRNDRLRKLQQELGYIFTSFTGQLNAILTSWEGIQADVENNINSKNSNGDAALSNKFEHFKKDLAPEIEKNKVLFEKIQGLIQTNSQELEKTTLTFKQQNQELRSALTEQIKTEQEIGQNEELAIFKQKYSSAKQVKKEELFNFIQSVYEIEYPKELLDLSQKELPVTVGSSTLKPKIIQESRDLKARVAEWFIEAKHLFAEKGSEYLHPTFEAGKLLSYKAIQALPFDNIDFLRWHMSSNEDNRDRVIANIQRDLKDKYKLRKELLLQISRQQDYLEKNLNNKDPKNQKKFKSYEAGKLELEKRLYQLDDNIAIAKLRFISNIREYLNDLHDDLQLLQFDSKEDTLSHLAAIIKKGREIHEKLILEKFSTEEKLPLQPDGTRTTYQNAHTLIVEKEKIDENYNLIKAVREWSKTIQLSLDSKIYENIQLAISKEVSDFLEWAINHPEQAINLLDDIKQILAIVQDRPLLERIQISIENYLIMDGYLNGFLKPTKPNITKDSAIPHKYRLLCDIFKSVNPVKIATIAGGLRKAVANSGIAAAAYPVFGYSGMFTTLLVLGTLGATNGWVTQKTVNAMHDLNDNDKITALGFLETLTAQDNFTVNSVLSRAKVAQMAGEALIASYAKHPIKNLWTRATAYIQNYLKETYEEIKAAKGWGKTTRIFVQVIAPIVGITVSVGAFGLFVAGFFPVSAMTALAIASFGLAFATSSLTLGRRLLNTFIDKQTVQAIEKKNFISQLLKSLKEQQIILQKYIASDESFDLEKIPFKNPGISIEDAKRMQQEIEEFKKAATDLIEQQMSRKIFEKEFKKDCEDALKQKKKGELLANEEVTLIRENLRKRKIKEALKKMVEQLLEDLVDKNKLILNIAKEHTSRAAIEAAITTAFQSRVKELINKAEEENQQLAEARQKKQSLLQNLKHSI